MSCALIAGTPCAVLLLLCGPAAAVGARSPPMAFQASAVLCIIGCTTFLAPLFPPQFPHPASLAFLPTAPIGNSAGGAVVGGLGLVSGGPTRGSPANTALRGEWERVVCPTACNEPSEPLGSRVLTQHSTVYLFHLAFAFGNKKRCPRLCTGRVPEHNLSTWLFALENRNATSRMLSLLRACMLIELQTASYHQCVLESR